MDSLGGSHPLNAPPKTEIHGGGALSHCFGGGGCSGKLPLSMPYVEVAEDSLETAFQSFEVVSNTSVESLPMRPRMSGAPMMVARVMLGHNYEPGMGLGENNDDMASLVDIK